jgi:hypothetical protein
LLPSEIGPEGVRVKLSKIFVLLALVGIAASAAMADGVDPTVVIRQVDPPPTPITDPNGTIGVFATAQQNIFAFQNDTGVTLLSLTVTLFGLNTPLDFSFGENPGDGIFANTFSFVNSNGSTTLMFSGIDEFHTGLLAAACNEETNTDNDLDADDCVGGIYSIEIDGIPVGAVVVGSATVSAPEPGTLVLLFAGLAGLAVLGKRRIALQN